MTNPELTKSLLRCLGTQGIVLCNDEVPPPSPLTDQEAYEAMLAAIDKELPE